MTSLPMDRRLATTRLSPIRILHVDDDREFVELAATFLERQNESFEVETATSAEAGLERLEADGIDCIVSDFDMPGTDGLEFLRTVRESHPTVPFVLFTGKGSEEVASDAVSAGVTEYLQKGTGTEQYLLLANRIEQAVSRARAERRVEQGFRAMDIANEGIALLDDEERFVFTNETFEELFGYDPAELVGERWSLLDPSGTVETAAVELQETERWTGETELRRADGSAVVTEVSVERTTGGDRIYLVANISESKEQERALHEERQRFDLLIDAVSEYAIFTLDADGHVTSWNDGAERITGYEADEILGEHVSTFYPASAVETRVPEELLARARREGSVEDEGWRIRRDGSRFWAHVTITAINDDEGRLAGFGKVTRDLPARHRREEELRMEGKFLEAALNTLDDVFYVLDVDFEFRRINDRLATVTGYTKTELDSMSLLDLIVPEEREAVRRRLRRVLEEDDGAAELTIRTKAGETIPFEVNQSQLLDEAGTPIGVVGIGRDLSSRRARERDLELRTRQQEVVARLGHSALDDIPPDDLFDETVRTVAETLDVDYCKVLELDAEAEQLTLRAGVGWHDGYVGTATVDTDRDSQAGYTLLSEEPVVVSDFEEENRFTAPPLLTEHDVASGISVVVGSVDDPWGVLGVHDTAPGGFADTDVNFVQSVANILASAIENRSHKRRLERQKEQLETFASVLSHDLRNPLGVAQGRLELGRKSCDNEHLAAVSRAHDRMAEMIEELLSTARESGGVDPSDEIVLSRIAEAAWDAVATEDATLRVDSDGRIEADPGQLQHVFENLFGNAVQHGGPDVTVWVGTLDGGGFYVEDDGPGIPEGHRQRVFEEGYTTDENGSGFGLRIVDRIVAAHGWEITSVDGTDGGARFEVRDTTAGSA